LSEVEAIDTRGQAFRYIFFLNLSTALKEGKRIPLQSLTRTTFQTYQNRQLYLFINSVNATQTLNRIKVSNAKLGLGQETIHGFFLTITVSIEQY
jgi:hypothetical protein